MNWTGIGFGTAFEVCFRELELFARRLRFARNAATDPDKELPHVELSEGDRRAALQREADRRRREGGRL